MRNIVQTGIIYGKTVTLKQVTKKTAEKLFSKGIEIYLQSCKMNPINVWQSAVPVKLDEDLMKQYQAHYEFCKENGHSLPVYSPDAKGLFAERVNNFIYYNCDNERGQYVNYYVKT